jgi:hypothetical protein
MWALIRDGGDRRIERRVTTYLVVRVVAGTGYPSCEVVAIFREHEHARLYIHEQYAETSRPRTGSCHYYALPVQMSELTGCNELEYRKKPNTGD